MSLIRKGLVSTVGKAVGAALQMVSGIILSRTLGPAGMGSYRNAAGFNVLTTVLASAGIGQAGIYFANNEKVPIQRVATTMLWIMLGLCPLTVIVLVLVYPLFPAYFAPFSMGARVGFAASCATAVAYYLFLPLLVAQLSMGRNAAAEIVLGGTYALAAAILVLSRQLSVQTVALVPLAASSAALITVLVMVRGQFDLSIRPDWRLIRGLLKFGAKLLAGGLALNAHTQAPALILGWIFSREDQKAIVGYFTCATGVTGMIGFVGMAVNPLLYSIWSGVSETERRARQVETAARLHVLLGFTVAIGVAIFAKYIVLVLYRAPFLPAVPLLRIVAFASALHIVASAQQNIFSAMGRPLLTTGLLIATLSVNVVLNLLLVPRFAAYGSAIATIVSAAVFLMATTYVTKRLCGLRISHSFIPKREDFERIFAAIKSRRQPGPDMN